MVNQLDDVHLATEQGANAFLEQPTGPDGFNFFSADLKIANAIRKRERKKGKLNNSDRQTLRYIYEKMVSVAGHSDEALFLEKVPRRELEAWLNHVVEVLRQITNDRKWINTGELLVHDRLLMLSLVALLQYGTAVILIMHEIKVLETISDMISTLEKPPTEKYAKNVVAIVECVHQSCRCQFEPKWRAEKTFKKLESTGILEHFLRSSALDSDVHAIFKDLLGCTAYVQKRFKEGTPCGDAVRAILKGTDEQHVRPYMESLVQLSKGTVGVSMLDNFVHCHFCHKEGSKENVKHCAKCLQAVYCSRECQKADWKSHKKACIPRLSRSHEKNALASQHLVSGFVSKSYVNIMLKMVEECDKAGGLKIDEMVAELNVVPDSSGTIPLMKDPPEFHIVPVAKYMDGSRFEEPDSVFVNKSCRSLQGETERQKYDRTFLAMLESHQSNRKPTELICIVSHERTYSLQSFDWTDKGSQIPVFSQEALGAFRRRYEFVVANRQGV